MLAQELVVLNKRQCREPEPFGSLWVDPARGLRAEIKHGLEQ